MTTLSTLSLILSVVLTSINIIILVSKPFRKAQLKTKNEQEAFNKEHETVMETDRCLLRDRITSIYYQYLETKHLKNHQFENIVKLYTQYKKLGGNSFVDIIFNEIKDEWTIID